MEYVFLKKCEKCKLKKQPEKKKQIKSKKKQKKMQKKQKMQTNAQKIQKQRQKEHIRSKTSNLNLYLVAKANT